MYIADVLLVDFADDHDVVELDVAMEDVPGVHVADGGEELSHDAPDDVLAEDELVGQAEEVAAFTELGNHE